MFWFSKRQYTLLSLIKQAVRKNRQNPPNRQKPITYVTIDLYFNFRNIGANKLNARNILT